jgi:hypothetical protein
MVKGNSLTDVIHREILDVETHHNHEIIKDDYGTLRWKENEDVSNHLKKISLNDLCPLLVSLGYDKNSEVYRKLYRDMGYSLFGYWEVFYWEMNNKKASEYRPNASKYKLETPREEKIRKSKELLNNNFKEIENSKWNQLRNTHNKLFCHFDEKSVKKVITKFKELDIYYTIKILKFKWGKIPHFYFTEPRLNVM